MISRSSTSLLICDIQTSFRDKILNFPSLLSTTLKVTKSCQVLGINTILTEQYPKGLGWTVKEIKDLNLKTFEKTSFSMACDSVLDSLKTSKTESVILLGLESHVCILQTALDLRSLGFQVYVVKDGISSINRGEVSIAIDRMKQAGCNLTSSESVILELVKDAKDSKFKEISLILKEFREETKKAMDEMS